MVEAFLLKHKVHVAWPVAMPLQQLQQLADRSIVRDWVWHWHNRLEPEQPFLVTVHHCSLIWLFPTLILHVVFALAIRFPDVYLDAWYRLSVGVLDCADDEARFTTWVMGDLGTIGLGNRIVGMEGSEDGALGAGWWFRMVDAVDKERETEDV